MGKGLSPLQEDILTWLLRHYELADQPGNERYRDGIRIWGVHWQPAKIWDWSDWPDGYSRSVAAAVSRAVVRLEKRGLVLRNSQFQGTPTPQPAVDFWTREPIIASGRARNSVDQLPPTRCTNLMLTDAGRKVARAIQDNS